MPHLGGDANPAGLLSSQYNITLSDLKIPNTTQPPPPYFQSILKRIQSVGQAFCVKSPKFTLNPVGHQSTNWIDLADLMEAMATFTSLGTTSPRYSKHTAIYLPAVVNQVLIKIL